MSEPVEKGEVSSVSVESSQDRLPATDTLKSQQIINQKILSWLKENKDQFFNKIDLTKFLLLLSNKKDNPKTNLGLKKLLEKNPGAMKKALKEITDDDFFLSILADCLAELYLINKNLNLNQYSALLLSNALEKYFSFRDPLTEVWNREALELIYEQEIALDQEFNRKHFYIFAFLDLNNFKTINETFGHDRGDQALLAFCQAVTETLNSQARKSDVFARWGGDEFVIIFQANKPENQQELMAIAKRLIHILGQIQNLYRDKLLAMTNQAFDLAGFSVGLQTQTSMNTGKNDLLEQYLNKAETATKAAKLEKNDGGIGINIVFAQELLRQLIS